MGEGNILISLLPLIAMFAIFYFLLIRPQQKRQKQTKEMQAALKKGDKIVTIGGVHGTVDAIDEDQGVIVLEAGNSKLTFERGAVSRVKEQL